MVNQLTKIFRTIGDTRTNFSQKNLPMINSVVNSFESYLSEFGQIRKKKALMRWYRGIGELTGLVNKVAKDMVSDWKFVSIGPKQNNKNKLLKANKFAQQISLYKLLLAQAIDILVTGESFGWIGKISEKQLKEHIQSHMGIIEQKESKWVAQRIFNEIKATQGIADTTHIDEDLLRPRKYRAIPSSTIEIVHDQYDVLHYNQVVGTNKEKFMPDQVIHFSQIDLDGKPYGFTPIESIIVQLELLRQMWQNMLSIHKNGGSPDKIFVLEDTQPNSPAYKRMVDQLEKYKLVENKHGNMVFTGKVNVQELMQLEKMQFMDSGLYITGLIAMQWQIPRSSIPYIVGGTNTKDDTGGNSERGYWDNIEFAQRVFAETMNTQLWMPHFGVKIEFEKTYINKDVQIQTAKNWEYNNIKLMDSILYNRGKAFTEDYIYDKFGITKDDVEEKEIETGMDVEQIGKNNQLSEDEVVDSDDKKNVKKKKAQEQQDLMNSRGKPTGAGKEFDLAAQTEYKQLVGVDTMGVPLDKFIRLYNEDKAYQQGKPPRIFKRTNDMFTSYTYKSSDFVYKAVIPNEEIEDKAVLIMNLGANIIEL